MADWRFINIDRTTDHAVITGKLPEVGDGKTHNGRGYQIVAVVKKSIAYPDDLVLAAEHAPAKT